MFVSTYSESTSEVIEGKLVARAEQQNNNAQGHVSIYDKLQGLVDDNTVLVDELALPTEVGQKIAEGIRLGHARAVSDGSFKDSYGTAAGVIAAAEDDNDLLYLVTAVPGLPYEQSSYRSELAGILGILHVLETLCLAYEIKEGALTIALDGKEAMKQASYSNTEAPLQAGQNSFDLLVAIRNTCNTLPIKIQWKWVEGHQAEKGKRLDWWGKNNQTVDALAKQYWNSCQSRHHPNTPRPIRHENVHVSINGTKLSCFHKKKMYTDMYGPHTKQYWNSKTNFSTAQFEMIMWPDTEWALHRLPFGLQCFWVKFATGFLGTGKKQQLRGYQEHSNCPRCGAPDEDNVHILRCPSQEANTQWQHNINGILLELQRLNTAPLLSRVIVENLNAWHTRSAPFIPETNQWGERDAAVSQQGLGWTNFTFGRWHQDWAKAQQNYFTFHQSKRSSKRWTTAIIYKLYMTAWDLWDHRNKTLHAPGGPKETREAMQLAAEISNEFEQGCRGLRLTDQHLFHEPLPTILGRNLSSQRKWLHSVQLARKLGPATNVDDTAQLRRQQAMMSRWLVSALQPPSH